MELGDIDSDWGTFGPYDLSSESARWDDETLSVSGWSFPRIHKVPLRLSGSAGLS